MIQPQGSELIEVHLQRQVRCPSICPKCKPRTSPHKSIFTQPTAFCMGWENKVIPARIISKHEKQYVVANSLFSSDKPIPTIVLVPTAATQTCPNYWIGSQLMLNFLDTLLQQHLQELTPAVHQCHQILLPQDTCVVSRPYFGVTTRLSLHFDGHCSWCLNYLHLRHLRLVLTYLIYTCCKWCWKTSQLGACRVMVIFDRIFLMRYTGEKCTLCCWDM